MEDSIQNLLQTLQVSGHAFWTHQCTGNVSGTGQQHHQSTPRPHSNCLPGRLFIYSNTQWEHTTHVKDVLRCLRQAGLKLKPEKCEFNKPEVEFLGYIIGINGIKMDPNKITAIRDWPQPTTVKEVQAFLGFANFN